MDLYKRAFDFTPDGLLVIDGDGRITNANGQVEKLFGYSRVELIGEPIENLVPGWLAAPHVQTGPSYVAAPRRHAMGADGELFGCRKDKSEFPLEIMRSPIGAEGETTVLCVIRDIAERKRAEEALRESEDKLRGLYELSPIGIALTDMDGRYIEFNAAFQTICGYPPEELKTLDYWTLTPSRYAAGEARQLESLHSVGHYGPYEKEYIRKDGSLVPLRLHGMLITGTDGKKYIWSIVEDISDRKRIEADLQIAAIAFQAQVGILVTDSNRVILRVNQALADSTGYSVEELLGQTPTVLESGRHDAKFYAAMWEKIGRTGSWQGEIWNRRKGGDIFPNWLTVTAVRNPDGVVTHYVGTQIDITESKEAEDAIKHLAFYDALTRLPNRRLLLDRLHQALAASVRSHRQAAVLLLDLDNFKTLNDSLGHDVGDVLLQQVARRISDCVREADTVARFGGDEFVVLLENLSQNVHEAAAQTEEVGAKILAALNQSYVLSGHEYHGTASVGVTLFGSERTAVDQLLKQADLAMYQAKAVGRNALRFFDPQMQAEIAARVGLEGELHKALRERQFVVHYQAQVDQHGHLTGAEVLVRWWHQNRGLVLPGEFIHLAEETGLIRPLGRWVLETACMQLATWARRGIATDLALAVNVSAHQIRQPDFVDMVRSTVHRTGADPHKLKLELTESLLMGDVEETIVKMTALRALGIGFALDDFGTGFSCLSYLKRLPLEALKIDRSFIKEVLTDLNDASIAKAIVALAHGLGLTVIAEGVETEEQRDFLARHGCIAYQGDLFSRPLPVEEFELLLVSPAVTKVPG